MIPNEWMDATPAAQWRLDEERERASVEFTTAHGKIWWNGSLKSDKSLEFVRNTLKKLGWNGDQNSRDLATVSVRIKVEEEIYNGKPQQKIAAISTGSGDRAPKDPVKARSLAAKLSGSGSTGSRPTFADDDEGDTSFP
jgi:hypothetical protein